MIDSQVRGTGRDIKNRNWRELKMESIIQSAISRQITGGTGSLSERPLDEFAGANDAKIMVMGAGGMGCNAVNRLHSVGITGAETIALNTDMKHLRTIQSDRKILLGQELTKGLGAGGYAAMGKQAAEESINEIRDVMRGVDMLFLVAGMGGGTGTGAAPVIAEYARSQNSIV